MCERLLNRQLLEYLATVHTLCNKLLYGDLIPADCKHFPEVAANSGAGAGPGRPSEPAALGLWHSGKLLHPSLSLSVRPPNAVLFGGKLTTQSS